MIGRRSSGKKERVCLGGERGEGEGVLANRDLYFLFLRGGLIERGAIAVANCGMMYNAAWLRLTSNAARERPTKSTFMVLAILDYMLIIHPMNIIMLQTEI